MDLPTFEFLDAVRDEIRFEQSCPSVFCNLLD